MSYGYSSSSMIEMVLKQAEMCERAKVELESECSARIRQQFEPRVVTALTVLARTNLKLIRLCSPS